MTCLECRDVPCLDRLVSAHGRLGTGMWATFGVVAVVFFVRERAWRCRPSTVDATHSMEVLATWMALHQHRRRRHVYHDVERMLVQLAHSLDWIVFSAAPLQCLAMKASQGLVLWRTFPSPVQSGLVCVTGAGFVLLLSTVGCTTHVRNVKRHVLLPLCCEALFAVQVAGFAFAAMCPTEVCAVASSLAMRTPHTCTALEDGAIAIGGNLGMALLFYRTLYYKWHRHDDPRAVGFCLVPFTAALNGVVRTGAVLLHGLVAWETLEAFEDDCRVATASAATLYALVMIGLWRHHYQFQPFRGDGYAANNLYAAMFASAAYLSVVVAVAHGPGFDVFQTNSTVAWIAAAALYPGIVVAAYLFNAHVARDVAVPVRSVLGALDAASLRVKTVAALCLAQDNYDLSAWTNESLVAILDKLEYVETVPVEAFDGRAMAYALTATWTVARYAWHLTPLAVDEDSPDETFVPRHMWVKLAPSTCFDILHENVPATASAQARLRIVHASAVAMIEVPHATAQFMVARTLQEMFASGIGRLDLATLVRVVCVLCGAVESPPALASSAGLTLQRLCAVYSAADDIVPVVVADEANVEHLLRFLQRPRGAPLLRGHVQSAEVVTHLLRLAARHIQDAALNPSDSMPESSSTLFQAAWSNWHDQYFVSTALEETSLALHRAGENFTALHAARLAMTKTNRVTPPAPAPRPPKWASLRRPAAVRPTDGSKYLSREMWQVVLMRQSVRDEFAGAVQGLLHEGFAGHVGPGDLNGRGQRLLQKVLGMINTSPTLVLGHLHDSFPSVEVAYVRHLQLLAHLQGHDDEATPI
ncbi:hypothetical protein H310_10538 [Aphanomyces invadans]|uniref:Uncharacterized protein n=1 Tax=Aphanomyces invadans TaxID=157072 RepID=A0A024TQJ1_9STRA|nr:hypothetical protein H310_10538 [Aphanomyces invadans]ETV96385.1 hypothetical protein H310_10538 [Aphanomyces invadans]|eukprot:XP_008875177.1 hypothetical protein H310_10538 [Aphanomyces invadans]